MEGTTLGGGHKVGFEDEQAVEKALCGIYSNQTDVSFIMASGSNIDRLVSIYRAARICKKTLVLDLYTYHVLARLKKITPSLPPYFGDHLRIFYIRKHAQDIADHYGKKALYKLKTRKIEIDEIAENRQDMVLKLPVSAMEKISNELVKQRSFKKANFVFSMWGGYLEKDDSYFKLCDNFNLVLVKIHVSGHAYIDALKKLTQALSPKALIPIHTISSNDYSKYFDNVVNIDDGVGFNI
jgi:ribonuclease J